MFIDARMELNPPTLFEAGTHTSREIDFDVTGGAGRFNLNITLAVADKRGTVGASLQASQDGEDWQDVCIYSDLPRGQTPVRVPGFNKRFTRVQWRISERANVSARIDNGGEI